MTLRTARARAITREAVSCRAAISLLAFLVVRSRVKESRAEEETGRRACLKSKSRSKADASVGAAAGVRGLGVLAYRDFESYKD